MKTKKEWRKYYMEHRQALTVDERIQKSQHITEHYFKRFEAERPEVVHLFLPMATKSEVDTRFILQKLNEEYPEVRTVTSVIAEDQVSLLTIEVRQDTALALNSWGIPEPVKRIVFPEDAIEEVLTPLLAMDSKGYRIGYGKGFYDRFFASCSAEVVRTGLHFFPAVEQDLPQDPWDVPLHRLVYPDGVFSVDQRA